MPRYDPKLCGKFRDHVETWRKYFRDNIQQYHDYHRFVLGSQWEDDEENLLHDYNKVPLQFNKLAPLMNHLLGEQLMNTPNLEVSPDDVVIPEETVAVRQALVKEISLNSDAKTIYQIAFQQAAIGGYGAYRIGLDYLNNRSFDQMPMPQAFRDPTRCFWDIGAESPCKTDGMQAGFYARMSRKLFIKTYSSKIAAAIPPTVAETEEDSFASFEWNTGDLITIGEIYVRKLVKQKLYELSNGETVTDDELEKLETYKFKTQDLSQIDDDESEGEEEQEYIVYNGDLVTITRSRTVVSYKIKHYKWAGDYILDETNFPSQQLPIVFVDQNSYWDKTGKQICRPFVKDARDAQRFVNYLGTQIAYLIKISRYDQYMASRENMKSPKTQQLWRNPTVVQGVLVYDVDKVHGSKPEPLNPPLLPPTLIQQYERALADIQSSTGIYDTKVGENGNEVSGAAIDARTRQGAYNTFIVFNSLNRAIAVGGQIIDEMIPVVVDTQRKMTLEMPNRGKQQVILNQQADMYGTTTLNDMTQGQYKVRLIPGPSYEGQKSEGLQSLQLLLQANPELFNIIADLYAKYLPLPDNTELVNRVRTMVPPEIIEAGKTGKPIPPKPPQPDPMLILKMQELQLKQAQLQQKSQKDGLDYQVELQQIENQKLEIAGQVQEQILRYQAEMQRTETDHQIAHAQNIVELLTRPNHLNQPQKEKPHATAK